MGYEILLTAIFHIGLCNKFRDQSSVKGMSRQWEDFQKVRAGRILTTEISMYADRRYLYFFPDRKITKCWKHSYSLERKSAQKMVGYVMNGCRKRKTRTKIVLPFVNGQFHHIMWFKGDFNIAVEKSRLGTPKPKIKNPSKNEFLWFVLYEKLVVFFWDFGLQWIERYLSHLLYKSFQTMVSAIRSPIQWRPPNRKLAVCLTGNMKYTKRIVTSKLTTGHWTLFFFAIHLNLEPKFADYREKALFYSGHFKKKIRVVEVDNAGCRSLKMLK